MKNIKDKRILICISGGSGSGKSTVSQLLYKEAEKSGIKSFLLRQDNFYNSNWDKTMEEKRKTNYDHPDSFDWVLINNTLNKYVAGEECQIPVYDYNLSQREKNSFEIIENDVQLIIFEGLYTLYSKTILKHSSLSLYIDVDDDIRFIRRLKRDIESRGRTQENIINQWLTTVRPMHYTFIDQQKRKADLIVPWYKKTSIPIKVIKYILKEVS